MLTGIKEMDGHGNPQPNELEPAAQIPSDDESSDEALETAGPNQRFVCEIDRLELIFGCLSSGKSSELGRRLKIKSLYRKVLGVNTAKDTRYGNQGIITHDRVVFPCIRVNLLSELLTMPEYKEAKVIGIDEANFYPDLKEFVVSQLELTGKSFIVCGLNGDKDQKFFGHLHELLPHADKIDFLRAVCKHCGDGTGASFTINLKQFEGQEQIGGAEWYEAVCRKHFHALRYQQAIDRLKVNKSGLKLSIE